MKYIYDRILNSKKQEITYLETVYSLVNRTMMGSLEYFTYRNIDDNNDVIIIVTSFVKEYLEVVKKFSTIKNCASVDAATIRIRKAFDTEPEVDELKAEGRSIKVFTFIYKNISIMMQLEDGVFKLSPKFNIISGNPFGNNFPVYMGDSPDIEKYKDLLELWLVMQRVVRYLIS